MPIFTQESGSAISGGGEGGLLYGLCLPFLLISGDCLLSGGFRDLHSLIQVCEGRARSMMARRE